MGSTHSVHILMSINLEVVGRTLLRSARLKFNRPSCQPLSESTEDAAGCEETDSTDVPSLDESDANPEEDSLWAEAHLAKRLSSHCWETDTVRPTTLQEFIDAAEAAKRSPERVLVFVHLFSGANRDGDLEDHLRKEAAAAGIRLLVISVDLGADLNWDISDPLTFHTLHDAVVRGLIDGIGGGPPCATWARSRFLPNGPRPVRFRDQPWGRLDLTASEHDRVTEANTLMVNFLALCEACATRGGLFLLEHPKDPEVPPFPFIWATDAYNSFEERCGAHQTHLDQCALGCICQKPTTLSSNIVGFPLEVPKCPGDHVHGRATGKTRDGKFRSRRLAAYPSEFCRWMAVRIIASFARMLRSGMGPTGWLKRVTASSRFFVEDEEQTKKSFRPESSRLDRVVSKSEWKQTSHSRWEKITGGPVCHSEDIVQKVPDLDELCQLCGSIGPQ